MKQLQVRSDDFLCNRAHVLWLLGHHELYKCCPSFEPLFAHVKQLHAFMKKNGLTEDAVGKVGCSRCAAFKAASTQNILLDRFAGIFIQLSDADRMDELREMLVFVCRARRKRFRRLILAYAGKATKNQNRLVIVE